MDQPAYFKDGKTEGISGLKAHYKSAAHTARRSPRLSESEAQAVDKGRNSPARSSRGPSTSLQGHGHEAAGPG